MLCWWKFRRNFWWIHSSTLMFADLVFHQKVDTVLIYLQYFQSVVLNVKTILKRYFQYWRGGDSSFSNRMSLHALCPLPSMERSHVMEEHVHEKHWQTASACSLKRPCIITCHHFRILLVLGSGSIYLPGAVSPMDALADTLFYPMPDVMWEFHTEANICVQPSLKGQNHMNCVSSYIINIPHACKR